MSLHEPAKRSVDLLKGERLSPEIAAGAETGQRIFGANFGFSDLRRQGLEPRLQQAGRPILPRIVHRTFSFFSFGESGKTSFHIALDCGAYSF
jgi:hypothetical protein